MLVGETQEQSFQFSINSSLRIDFQGARVISDGGLILVRELDECRGLSELMGRHSSDCNSRRGFQIVSCRYTGSREFSADIPAHRERRGASSEVLAFSPHVSASVRN